MLNLAQKDDETHLDSEEQTRFLSFVLSLFVKDISNENL